MSPKPFKPELVKQAARSGALRLAGLLYAALLVWALYLGWEGWRDGAIGLFGRDGLLPLPASWRFLFAYEEDLRLPLQLIAAFLLLTFADWLWRATLGRLAVS